MKPLWQVYSRVLKARPDAAVPDGKDHALMFDTQLARWRIAPRHGDRNGGALVTEPIASALITEHWLDLALQAEESTELSFLPAWTRPGCSDADVPKREDIGILVINAANHPEEVTSKRHIEAWGCSMVEALGEYLIELGGVPE